ncbi:T9SS type A sorting domain-containing protein [Adhaeribacter sp. BT258]|uniref:T9SS type A sorting domain-containing protein n=1 Tax=Adhaeribacter terrigena TaxID=2793070 RepID=A0ABS1BY03_9BACT|nr:T9SS type A sorting domain-containing protein [Adhaeribacter terrigena]MBK0402040.1 T9SS type A sorting domain-containing protein [Adhaeribacter terrigena]
MIRNLAPFKAACGNAIHAFSNYRIFSLLSAFLLLSLLANGQTKIWDKNFGGTGNDELEFMQHTDDGGYILGGSSESGISGSKTQASRGGMDYWVVKLNSQGKKEWDRRFGGSGRDILEVIRQTCDGGYILGGSSDSPESGDKSKGSRGGNDYWVVKISSKGKKQWDRTLGGMSTDGLRDIIQTKDEGYLLGGWSISGIGKDKSEPSRGANDYWVVKLSSSGSKSWDKTLGGNSADLLSKVLQTPDGGYLLGGASVSVVSGDKTDPQKRFCEDECEFDMWVVKINSKGKKMWDRTIGGVGGEQGESVAAMVSTKDGGFLLGGSSDSGAGFDKTEPNKSFFSDYRDYWVVKINATGVIQWDKTIGGLGDDALTAMVETKDGGFLLGGRSDSDIGADKTEAPRDNTINTDDFWVIRISSTGNILWDKTLGGSGDDQLTTLDRGYPNKYIVGGISDSPVSGDKTKPNQGGYDYWIVKLEETSNPSIALPLTPNSASQSLASWQAYPNPLTSSTTLALTFPETQDYTLEIYNFAGELIKRWPTASAEAGQQVKITWLPEQAKSGLYIARLITSNGAQHLQLIKE